MIQTNDGDYKCPFCITTTICDGPHIPPEHIPSFFEYLYHIKIDLIETSKEIAVEYGEKYDLDTSRLQEVLAAKLYNRTFFNIPSAPNFIPVPEL